MNEYETEQLYQKIFSPDRIERWESWQRDGHTKSGMQASGDHPLAEISKTQWRWKSGVTVHGSGYRCVRLPSHPRAGKQRGAGSYVFEHILVVESVMGKFLPQDAVVHHINEIKDDNVKTNLLVCENQAYHQQLHGRLRAFQECGHADWMKCSICGQYDSIDNLYVTRIPPGPNQRMFNSGRHKECHRIAEASRYRLKLQSAVQSV